MTINNNNKLANYYILTITLIGLFIFLLKVDYTASLNHLPMILVLTLSSTVLAIFKIKLPLNGNSFSLDSSIYLAILFIYGLEIALTVLLFTISLEMIVNKRLARWKHISNFGIYTFILYASSFYLDFFHVQAFSNETLVSYVIALLLYLVLNTLILSIYFALLQGESILKTIQLLTNDAIFTYLITLIMAILVSYLLISSHLIGLILFTIVALLMSLSYRRYFKMFKELRGMQQTYQSLFDYNPDLVFMFDINGKLTKVNDNFTNVTGYSEAYFRTKPFISIFAKEDWPLVRDTYEKVISGVPQTHHIEIIHKDGKKLKMEVTVVPMVVSESIQGIIGYAKDVTLMKATEEMLKRSEKLSVVGELAAGVAHEIRNPLTTIRGFLQLEKKKDSDAAYFQSIMIDEIDRINFIVSEFLALAKPQKLSFEKRSIAPIINEILALTQSEANLHDVIIDVNIENDLPAINCEKNQLKQVFINIMKNGMEAMPQGGKVKIDVFTKNNHVVIRFIDEGVGIPKERMERIGEPFFTLKEKGMGLGMTMSFKIIEEHSGEIKIKSKVGVGTTVDVLLPIV
jgi:PAS domain S-box-containing protein